MIFLPKPDPRLTDYDTLLQNVQDLKAGKQVQIPIYDFKSSSRTGYRFNTSPFNSSFFILYKFMGLNHLTVVKGAIKPKGKLKGRLKPLINKCYLNLKFSATE